jgi:hypothetical protein
MLELGLNGRELNALAVVNSFWRKYGDWFRGSASYLAKWMGVKKNETVYRTLSSLVKKGLLEKRERWEKGEKMCDYRPVRKTDGTSPENGQGTSPKNGHQIDRPESKRENKKEIYKESFTHLPVDDFIKSIR